MNKSTGIALVLLALVAIVVAVVWGGSEDVDEPREFGAIENLNRVEIMPPAAQDGPELIALERRGDDGQWWITRPVEALVDWRHAEALESVFGKSLGTDDVEIDGGRADEYDLGEDRAVRLALFEAGRDRPVREFLVGREFQVVQTGARRTFVQMPGEDRIYRAQAAFGELVRLGVAGLRDRALVSVGEEGIESIQFRHRDGHEVQIDHRDGRWHLADGPSAAVGLDAQRATRIAATVGRLEAEQFVDKSPNEVGLDEPLSALIVTTGHGDIRIEMAMMEGGDDAEDRYFARRDESDVVAELDVETARLLMSRLSDLRSRALIQGDSSAITEIELADEQHHHFARNGEGWRVLHPEGRQVEPQRVDRLAEFIAGLRVARWLPEAHAGRLGLEEDLAPRIRITVDGESTVLTLGDPVEKTRGARYASYSHAEDVFTLPPSAVKRLTAFEP